MTWAHLLAAVGVGAAVAIAIARPDLRRAAAAAALLLLGAIGGASLQRWLGTEAPPGDLHELPPPPIEPEPAPDKEVIVEHTDYIERATRVDPDSDLEHRARAANRRAAILLGDDPDG